jgi:hypothetical protein
MANQPWQPKSAWSGKPMKGADNRTRRQRHNEDLDAFILGRTTRSLNRLPLIARPADAGVPAGASPLGALPRWLAEQAIAQREGK